MLTSIDRNNLAIELGIPVESIPENFTLSQKEYLMEMTDDWMDRQEKKTPTKKPLTPEEKTAQLFDTTFEDSFTVSTEVDTFANFQNIPSDGSFSEEFFEQVRTTETPVSASYEVPLPTGQVGFNISTVGFGNEAPEDNNGKRVAALGLQGFEMVKDGPFIVKTTQQDIPITADMINGPMYNSIKQQFDERYGEGSFQKMYEELQRRTYPE